MNASAGYPQNYAGRMWPERSCQSQRAGAQSALPSISVHGLVLACHVYPALPRICNLPFSMVRTETPLLGLHGKSYPDGSSGVDQYGSSSFVGAVAGLSSV